MNMSSTRFALLHQGVQEHRSLERLILQNNQLNDSAALELLVDLVVTSECLQYLDLRGNAVPVKRQRKLAAAITIGNITLTHVLFGEVPSGCSSGGNSLAASHNSSAHHSQDALPSLGSSRLGAWGVFAVRYARSFHLVVTWCCNAKAGCCARVGVGVAF
jgi:hypothetical protein